MPVAALSFLAGTLLLQALPQLIPIEIVVFALIVSLTMTLITRNKSHKLHNFSLSLTSFVCGSLLATFTASKLLENRLPQQLERKDIIVQGYISGVPTNNDESSRFILQIDKSFLSSSDGSDVPINLNGKVRLGWYRNSPQIQAGEYWQLKIRLKRPSGFQNPGGFDYEKWLFAERIIATGYVRNRDMGDNKKLTEASLFSVNSLRQYIHETLQKSVEDKTSSAVLSALLVANRSDLSEQQWDVLQKTGTTHLIAISGLHIAVVAGFGFLPIFLLWRVLPRLNERLPLRVAGGILGVFFAVVYSLLAGFTLPTQRALLMVVIALFALMFRKHYSSFTILSIAMIAVLILDPLAGMSISFWLSFIAVGLILIFLKRQVVKPKYSLIQLQIVLSLAMLPLTLLFFNTASLNSPLSNLIAIPWVSFIVVPLSIFALLLMPVSSAISNALFNVSALSIDWLFIFLNYLSNISINQFTLSGIPSIYLVIGFIGLLILLLPKGFPARWVGLIAFFPLLLFQVEKPQQGDFEFTLLDAGQGMASVVRTANHTLVYDVGTRMSDRFDLGKLVVIPYLKSIRSNHIDTLVLSHDDIDHKGGAEEVLNEISVDKILGSHRTIINNKFMNVCIAGSSWDWDGVTFEVLSPSSDSHIDTQGKYVSDNNLSCVIRVSNGHHTLLLTGDIEKSVEESLITQYGESLQADVMSVPHHGSKTSSSSEFLSAVSPRLALVPAGYLNRFGHPKQTVLDRYENQGIPVMGNVESGAITIQFSKGADFTTQSYREKNSGFWSR